MPSCDRQKARPGTRVIRTVRGEPDRFLSGIMRDVMEMAWKPDWEETKRHFTDWWNHKGLVLGMWAPPLRGEPHEKVEDPGPAESVEQFYTDAVWKAKHNHYNLSRSWSPADVYPKAGVDIGPGSLALFLGSPEKLSMETVWYYPTMQNVEAPEKLPPLKFDPENRWWKIHEALARESAKLAKGKYLVGFPDLIENVDILASLRETLTLFEDMIERPDWVLQKLEEINQVFFEAYDRLYEIIKLEDGSSSWNAFSIWGPGKVAKVQCDASAMLSPKQFEKFVVPALSRQCAWLDYSMFHLDGEHCIPHLDLLLGIKELDAIEWTPNPKVAPGGDPIWHDMYRKILKAGKSVQAIGVQRHEVIPLLDACGGKGMYVMTSIENEEQAENLIRDVEPYR